MPLNINLIAQPFEELKSAHYHSNDKHNNHDCYQIVFRMFFCQFYEFIYLKLRDS